jgi:hypothetical protein
MYKTLSFICNYTENVFVTYEMKHFGHFSENNMYICIYSHAELDRTLYI